MSTVKANNVQVGQSGTATNNFTLYQPSTPDGTVRLAVGNSGATSADVLTANSSGNVGVGTSSPNANGKLTVAGNIVFPSAGNSLADDFGNNIIQRTAGGHITLGSTAWNQIRFGTAGGAQAMTLDASGYLLVGTTTSPSQQAVIYRTSATTSNGALLLNGNGNYAGIQFAESGNLRASLAVDSTALYLTHESVLTFKTGSSGNVGGTERARITSGGYFKASNDGTYLGSTGSSHEFRSNVTDATATMIVHNFSATATTDNIFQIRAKRNTTNNTFYAMSYYNEDAGAYKFRIADSGDVTNTSGTYGQISDAKMKTDIVDASSQWADIKAIRFRKFKMKNDPSGLVQLGVVAQELEQTSPGLVEEHADRDAEGNDLGTTTKSVKTSILLMKAAKALQEAMTRIETLEAKVAALEGTQP